MKTLRRENGCHRREQRRVNNLQVLVHLYKGRGSSDSDYLHADSTNNCDTADRGDHDMCHRLSSHLFICLPSASRSSPLSLHILAKVSLLACLYGSLIWNGWVCVPCIQLGNIPCGRSSRLSASCVAGGDKIPRVHRGQSNIWIK